MELAKYREEKMLLLKTGMGQYGSNPNADFISSDKLFKYREEICHIK